MKTYCTDRFAHILPCQPNCADSRRKIMFDRNGGEVEMCYACIASIPASGPVKEIVVRVAGYYDRF